MLDTYATSVLVMLELLISIIQIQMYIGMYCEYITHKCKIQTAESFKITLKCIGNTETGHFPYNYVIVNNIPDVPKDNFTRLFSIYHVQ